MTATAVSTEAATATAAIMTAAKTAIKLKV